MLLNNKIAKLLIRFCELLDLLFPGRRDYSGRAIITRHSFKNEYSYGNFKGDEIDWLEHYFDAFIYYANWGTHIFGISLPCEMLPFDRVQNYTSDTALEISQNGDKTIIMFTSESEPEDGWIEAGEWPIEDLLPIRKNLIKGDLRALYLGWLLAVQNDDFDADDFEIPVPAGLKELTPELRSLIDFLKIDEDLVAAAAINSPPLPSAASMGDELSTWLARMDQATKEKQFAKILTEAMDDQQTALMDVLKNFYATQTIQQTTHSKQNLRTMGLLLSDVKRMRTERTQREAAQKLKEQKLKEKAEKLAREKYLNSIKGQEPTLWIKIEKYIAEGTASGYKRAVESLLDLRDLAAKENSSEFHAKLLSLRDQYRAKRAFIQRLNDAALL